MVNWTYIVVNLCSTFLVMFCVLTPITCLISKHQTVKDSMVFSKHKPITQLQQPRAPLTNGCYLLPQQEGTSTQLCLSGCSWPGSCPWLGPSSTLSCNAWVPSVELEWWRASSRGFTWATVVVPMLSPPATPRVMALALRSLAPSSWSTPSSRPLMPRGMPGTPMFL